MAYVKVASKNEIEPGSGKVIETGGKAIALFNAEGEFYAIDNTCAHQGGPLGEGMLDGKVVTCPWHAWEYDVSSGKCQTNPSVIQKKYSVKVQGDDILLDL